VNRHSRCAGAALAATLAAFIVTGPARAADEAKYGKVKGWDIMAVTGGDVLLYCSAERDNGSVQLRVAKDSDGWKIGMPYYENGKAKGSWSFTGEENSGTFVSDGEGWAFLKVAKPMRKQLRKADSITLDLDRGPQTFELAGLKAAMKKVNECVKENAGMDSPAGNDDDDDEAMASNESTVDTGSDTEAEAPAPRNKKQSPEGQDLGNGMFLIPYANIDGWDIQKYGFDARGKQFQNCTAMKRDEAGVSMRLGYNNHYFDYGFNASKLMTGADKMQIRYWFDDDADSEQIADGIHVNDHDSTEWYSFQDENAKTTDTLDHFMNAQTINFAYKAKGKQAVETFELTGIRDVMSRLLQCGSGE
jgi:hypothetical protein